ncbi:MAG TPA: DUF4091 domain-containing protein, partial [Candidatus Hydrogenedentes bacterium]|nr:DUF4091 domain-containing protein [Candidatus Hydrogenedentota bacterium]
MRSSHFRIGLILLGVIGAILAGSGWAQKIAAPNGSFETGTAEAPDGWRLNAGTGGRSRDQAVDGAWSAYVDGTKDHTSYWLSEPLPLAPNACYVLRVDVFQEQRGGGPPVIGPRCSNYVLYDVEPGRWAPVRMYFQTPSAITEENVRLRLGHARMRRGRLFFDNVAVHRVEPVYRMVEGLILGDGEFVQGNVFESRMTWDVHKVNHGRALAGYKNTYFNHDAFLMGDGSELLMNHELAGRQFLRGSVFLAPAYREKGALIVEASTNGAVWEDVGRIADVRGQVIELPESMFPADNVFVRIRCEADEPAGRDFELNVMGLRGYYLRAEVDGPPVTATGKTHYVELLETAPELEVTVLELGDLIPHGENRVLLDLDLPGAAPAEVEAAARVTGPDGDTASFGRLVKIEPGSQVVAVPYELTQTGRHHMELTVSPGTLFRAGFDFDVSTFYESGYGEQLPASSEEVGLWRTSSGWKVGAKTPVPQRHGDALVIRAARNEAEAAQLVLSPRPGLTGLAVECTDLEGPEGATIAAGAVDILEVRYVPVTIPTDASSVAAPWPDPLPPLSAPIAVTAGTNQAIWVRVKVPEAAKAGAYRGTIRISAERYEAAAPITVEVYDFALPERMTCETAFGLSQGAINNYHGLETEADQRQVWDLYMEAMSTNHLSPYDPVPMDPFTATWPEVRPGDDVDPAGLKVEFDWPAWDTAMERALTKYHFNTFRLHLEGMGRGKWPAEHERSLRGFGEDTPEYKALFTSYATQMEAHLRERGWLDEAFVYWFDEPTPYDYPFVMESNRRLDAVAPDLRRMLTIHVEEDLLGGVDLWCPLTSNYEYTRSKARLREGEAFWWYVCDIPKAPYVTHFIDHPGTELRVWLWQTWKYEISGVLIWTTNLWTSPPAYPDYPQNPYADPMSWRRPNLGRGVRLGYGNGAGRLLYPPLECADGRPGRPILEGPVSSQRLEMLREGIEDYEYFVILRDLLKDNGAALSAEQRAAYEALLAVPEEVTTSKTTYTTDPAPIEDHRHRLARAI